MDLVAPLAVTVQGSACDQPDPQSWSRHTKARQTPGSIHGSRSRPGSREAQCQNTHPTGPPVDREATSAPAGADAYLRPCASAFEKDREGARPTPGSWSARGTSNLAGSRPQCCCGTVNSDADAPPSMGHWLAKAIPTCRPHFFADEGHVPLIVKHAETIARSLAG